MANILWAFLGALARALLPLIIKGCIRLSSKLGRVFLRKGWRGLRAKMLDMFTGRSRRKKTRDFKSGRDSGKEISEVDQADDETDF